jgi:hypothetical protein
MKVTDDEDWFGKTRNFKAFIHVPGNSAENKD